MGRCRATLVLRFIIIIITIIIIIIIIIIIGAFFCFLFYFGYSNLLLVHLLLKHRGNVFFG